MFCLSVSLKANCDDCKVEIKQIGVNPSGFDGFAMIKDAVYTVQHGTRIEILFNKYFHDIEFEPPPDDVNIRSNKRKLDETANESENKLIKMEKKIEVQEATKNAWECIDGGELYIFTSIGVKSSDKIAAFDMDGTLIKTKSGKVHPVDTKDWQLTFHEVPRKLKEYLDKGYKIVIMTNQAPIGKGRVKIEDFKIKIEKIQEKIQVPVQVFIATGKGIYRKPTIGMWRTLIEKVFKLKSLNDCVHLGTVRVYFLSFLFNFSSFHLFFL